MNTKKPQNQKSEKEKRSIEPPPPKKGKPRRVWLHVFPDDFWVPAIEGETIWEAFQGTNVELGGECGGLGTCGKCKIKVLSVIDPPTEEEKRLVDEGELEQGVRLACRTEVNRDLAISIGEAETAPEYFKILTTSHVLTTRYIPLSQLQPLIEKRMVLLPPDTQNGGLSDLDRVKLGLGPEYGDLKASLNCLQTLPQVLKKTQTRGAAVLHEDCLMAWQDRQEVPPHYGLVFDIGTSTLVGKLISLVDGTEVAVASRLNGQSRYASDVIGRLQYAKEHPTGLERLHRILMKDLNQITTSLLKTAGLEPDDIFVAVAAGNTTMQHLLLSLSPLGIAEAPFTPVLTDALIVNSADVGLQLNPVALLYTMPVKSGYIGGDLISFVLNSGVTEQEDRIILGLDLGTNGEIFLGNGKRLLTCSAAAGPAFEGARISYGMIAKAGAIEGVSFEEGRLRYRVIANIKPKGICGSGLVDLVAVLLHCRIIDHEGLIHPVQGGVAENLNSRLVEQPWGYDFLVASEEESYHNQPVYLTQKDVRELQLAKGAIAAGIKTLMDEMGIGVQDIHQVYLAGALGNYVHPASTIRTGILPRVNPEIVRSLGNAASLGASMALLSKNHWQRAKDIAAFIEHVELSYRHDFNQYFIEHMDFPKENLW